MDLFEVHRSQDVEYSKTKVFSRFPKSSVLRVFLYFNQAETTLKEQLKSVKAASQFFKQAFKKFPISIID